MTEQEQWLARQQRDHNWASFSRELPELRLPVVLDADRALEIALGVYDRLPVQERAAWRQPRDRFAHLGDHNADQPDRRSA